MYGTRWHGSSVRTEFGGGVAGNKRKKKADVSCTPAPSLPPPPPPPPQAVPLPCSYPLFIVTDDSHAIHNTEVFTNKPKFFIHEAKSEKPNLELVSTLQRNEFALFYREPAQRSIVIVNCFEVCRKKISFLCPFCTRPSGGPIIHEHCNYKGHQQCEDHGTRVAKCVAQGKMQAPTLPGQCYAGFWLFVTSTTNGVNGVAQDESKNNPQRKKRRPTKAEQQHQKEFVSMAWNRKHAPASADVKLSTITTVVQPPPPIPNDFTVAIPDIDDEPDLIDILAQAFESTVDE